jgi:hypothetical protein
MMMLPCNSKYFGGGGREIMVQGCFQVQSMKINKSKKGYESGLSDRTLA